MNSWKNPQDEKPKPGRIVKILSKGKQYLGHYNPNHWEAAVFGCNWNIIEKDFPHGSIIEGWKETNED